MLCHPEPTFMRLLFWGGRGEAGEEAEKLTWKIGSHVTQKKSESYWTSNAIREGEE